MARIHLTKRFEEKDIERWKKKAVKENRDLTNWMETILNTAAQDDNSVIDLSGACKLHDLLIENINTDKVFFQNLTQSRFNKEFKDFNPDWVKMRIRDRCLLYKDMIKKYYLNGRITYKQFNNWKLPTFIAKQVSKIDIPDLK